jgi:dTDP-4-amino-4,6-dideoxygalactose transaminase
VIPFVDLGRQHRSLGLELDETLLGAAKRGDFILGEDVGRFEDEFADYCEAKHCVGVNSGTAALQLGLEALGLGPGDEVIAPANTFIASVLPVLKLGATVVLVDCDETGAIDPVQVRQAWTRSTKAVIAVHLYGHPADLDPLQDFCNDARIDLVEDACQAHGARYKGRRVGSFGRFAAFSFYPSKNLGALGDGGALVTADDGLAEKARLLGRLGEEPKGTHRALGWNERLDTLQASILRLKLRHLDAWNERRRAVAAAYADALAGSSVELPGTADWAEHVWHLFVVRSARRDALREALDRSGIGTGIHYPVPLHLQPALATLGYPQGSFPVAEQRAREQLSLPMFAELEPDEVAFVAAEVQAFEAAAAA